MKRQPLRPLRFLIGFLVAAASPALHASPANDAFATAQILTGVPVDITGNNTGATLESGEINPAAKGGASVWYSWTAPSTGWFTVHTSASLSGNGLNTVLALFADGAAVASAGMLGHNDESVRFLTDYPPAVYPDGVGPSRMVFKATAGSVYKIAVHGFQGAAGVFELHIAAESPPGFMVNLTDFQPSVVDVSSGPALSDAHVSIETATPFNFATLSLLRPSSGIEIASASITSGDLVTGSSTNGTYSVELTVPVYQPPGGRTVRVTTYSFSLNTFLAWTSPGNDVVEDDYLLPHPVASLTVANTGPADSQAPQITSFTGLPASIDLAAGDAAFNLAFNATDDLSGVLSGNILLRAVGPGTSYPITSFDEFSRTGTGLNGNYTVPVTIFADSPYPPPGNYQVEVDLQDASGNLRRYGPLHESLPGGSTASITIAATPPANDHFAARVNLAATLPAVAAGNNRFATLEASESDLDDSTAGSVWYEWTPAATGWVSMTADFTSNPYASPILAVFTGSTIPTLAEIGRSDGSFPVFFGNPPLVFLAQAGTSYKIAVCGNGVQFPQAGPFDLQITAVAAPPVRVTGFSLSPSSVDVTGGPQNVTVDFTVVSASPLFAGGETVQAILAPTASTSFGPLASAFISSFNRISGDNLNGTYRVILEIPGYQPPGVWNLAIEISTSGQYLRWSPQGANLVQDANLIPQSGGGVSVINSGPPELDPPVLVSVSGLPASANVTNPVPVNLVIGATDDASGVASGSIQLLRFFEGSLTGYGIATFNSTNRTGGFPTNGTYSVSFDLTNFLPPGEYDLLVELTDASGSIRRYGQFYEPFPAGSTTRVIIGLGGSGYPAWAATQNFGSGGLNATGDDPNQDGTSNLLCYAFNMAPLPQAVRMTPSAGDEGGLPAISMVGNGANRRLRIEYVRRTSAGSGLTYRPQFCSNLSISGPPGWQDAGPGTPTTINSEWERVVIEDPVQGATSRFGRVIVEYSPP